MVPRQNTSLHTKWVQWLESVQGQPYTYRAYHRVCSLHFEPCCFYTVQTQRQRLKPDACPTIPAQDVENQEQQQWDQAIVTLSPLHTETTVTSQAAGFEFPQIVPEGHIEDVEVEEHKSTPRTPAPLMTSSTPETMGHM
ncbi:uncharacterized protein LOC135370290 isoform X1 [Ornithodoros turicata]|uniref:uncharacterized protein LOC135370290 isoform X1 n=1 Tax=Ornithodoros turicata TaxID=34597 RepID=UPI00313A0ED0